MKTSEQEHPIVLHVTPRMRLEMLQRARRYYAIVTCTGEVLRDVRSVFADIPGLVHGANLAIVWRGEKLVRVKDSHSAVCDDVMSIEQADWRIAQHRNAVAYGTDIRR